ncbi:DNA repair protein Rad1 [Cladophialophora carrionii]|uniref:DNA repair protein Rad1 n=1 Tax=Cladophialophora carrionii TaxID=86049 RepID=A0A1C1CN32_9EURO|nr:DNA repair protein Rad1 [Cladophialophora carrionii]
MSLYEVWQSAAGSPFQPTVGKESQLFVGLSLLLIGELLPPELSDTVLIFAGVIFTGLFALNKSPLSLPIFGVPASVAFG